MAHNRLIDSPGLFRPMTRLAAPVLAEETLTLMVTWTDWWLTGHFLVSGGDAVKAAMGLMGYTMWLIPSLFAAIAIGATAMVARRVGQRRLGQARLVANQAMFLGLLFAVAVTVLVWLSADWFVSAMQLRGESAIYAKQYLWFIVPIIPLIMIEQVGSACLRGAGDTLTGFLAKAIVVAVNVVVSATLVSGAWGFEPWGFSGIALGTAVGHSVGGCILLFALLRGRAGLRLGTKHMRPRMKILKPLLHIGLPGGMDLSLILLCQLVFVALINSMGKASGAAHGLAVQIEACAYLPAHAFQVAAATMAGQFLGAKLPDRAVRSSLACVFAAMTLISIAGVLMYFFGIEFAAFFTGSKHDPTSQQAAELLRIVALALPSLAVVMVISGALRGAGDTIWPFAFSMIGFLLIRIPLAVVLCWETIEVPWLDIEIPGAGWGVAGAWSAMAIDLIARSVMIAARFLHGGWKRIKV